MNYYLNILKDAKANEEYRCILKTFSKELHVVDSYVR